MFTTRDRIRGYRDKKAVDAFFKPVTGPYDKAWIEALKDGRVDSNDLKVLFFLTTTTHNKTDVVGEAEAAARVASGTSPDYAAMWTALKGLVKVIPGELSDTTGNDFNHTTGFDVNTKDGLRYALAATDADRDYHVKKLFRSPSTSEYATNGMRLKYLRTAWAMKKMKHVNKQIPLFMRPSKTFKGATDPKWNAMVYTFQKVENQTTLANYLNNGNILTAKMLFEILVARWALVKNAGIVFMDDHDSNILVQLGRGPRPYRILNEHFLIDGPMIVLIDPDDFKLSTNSWIDDKGTCLAGEAVTRVINANKPHKLETEASVRARVKSQFQAWLEVQYLRNRIEGRALDVVRSLIRPGQHTLDALSLHIKSLIEILTGRQICTTSSGDADCRRINIRITRT